MAEPELHAAAAVDARENAPGLAMVEPAAVRSLAGIALYGDDPQPLLLALGENLPPPGRQMRAGGVIYFWSGPASWLALADHDDPAFSANLAARLAGTAAVTDQSDGRAIFRVHGPSARDALAKLLPIDLHPAVFTEDATALTLAGHINVQLWQCGTDDFELACFRSFAGALYDALQEACQAFQIAAAGQG